MPAHAMERGTHSAVKSRWAPDRGVWVVWCTIKPWDGGDTRVLRRQDADLRIAQQRMEAALDDFQQDPTGGKRISLGRSSRFAVFAEKWIEHYEATSSNRLQSIRKRVRQVRRDLVPLIGDRRLGELDVDAVSTLYLDLVSPRRARGRDGAPLTNSDPRQMLVSARQSMETLKRMCRFAMERGWMLSNPVDAVELKRSEKSAPRVLLSDAEQQFVRAAELWSNGRRLDGTPRSGRRNPYMGFLVRLLLLTGMRRSEALGLRVHEDVDLSGPRTVLHVRGTILTGEATASGKVERQPLTKTASSVRSLELSAAGDRLVRDWISSASAGKTYLIETVFGTPVDPHAVDKFVANVCRQLAWEGDERITSHVFRKTAATKVGRYSASGRDAAMLLLGHAGGLLDRYLKRGIVPHTILDVLDEGLYEGTGPRTPFDDELDALLRAESVDDAHSVAAIEARAIEHTLSLMVPMWVSLPEDTRRAMVSETASKMRA